MSLSLSTLSRNNRTAFKALYKSAFPLRERIPLSLLARRARQGRIENLVIEVDGNFSGLMVTALKDDLALILFFAISNNKRGLGLGSRALKAIAERYKGKRIFLEIEDPEKPSENIVQRTRRKRFYLRAGLRETEIRLKAYGTDMELLAFSGMPTYEEYDALLRYAYDPLVYRMANPVRQ